MQADLVSQIETLCVSSVQATMSVKDNSHKTNTHILISGLRRSVDDMGAAVADIDKLLEVSVTVWPMDQEDN